MQRGSVSRIASRQEDPRTLDALLRNEHDALSIALARSAFAADAVRVVNPDLGGYSHLVASRQGLFAVNEERFSLVAHGLFFGITLRGSSIFVFEACDLPRSRTRLGRVVRLDRNDDHIVRTEVTAKALDNGCHQIDFLGDRLCVLDTYNDTVLSRLPEEAGWDRIRPSFERLEAVRNSGELHMNSLIRFNDLNLILLHNGGAKSGQPSGIALCDAEWNPVDYWTLPGQGCHNLALLEDGTILSCGSLAGELVSPTGFRLKVTDLMTRGLSVGEDTVAVGCSEFSSRRDRHLKPGAVLFLDRGLQARSVLDLPGAPTEIRRLDGRDLTLSDFVRQTVPRLERPATPLGSAGG